MPTLSTTPEEVEADGSLLLAEHDGLIRQLYLLAILRGAILWYAIEKLYILHIGLSIRDIVLLAIIAQSVKVFFEVPTSIVADRWNRRNILIGANLAMIACCVVLGLATSFVVYTVGVILWALNDALGAGTYEAFAYDTLALRGQRARFRHVYARMVSAELLCLGIIGIFAGILSGWFNFQINFFLTIIPMLMSIGLLLSMQEPAIVRTAETGLSWLKHFSGTVEAVKDRSIRWVVVLLIVILGFQWTWYEYYQLVGIDTRLPTYLFGFLIMVATFGLAAGAEISRHHGGNRKMVAALWLSLLFTQLLGLRSGHAGLALVNIFLTFIAMRALRMYLEIYLHERIDSAHRATVLSLASTLSYGIFFVGGLLLTWLLPHYGVRTSLSIIGLPIMIIAIVDILRRSVWAGKILHPDSP